MTKRRSAAPRFTRVRALILAVFLAAGCAAPRAAFPRTQVVPQPDDQVAFLVDGREVLRYHYGAAAPKPYFFPVIGPAGRPVTRIGHPHDPVTHGHHLSLWIGHQNVGGSNFWEQHRSRARIVHDRILKIEDGEHASLTIAARWIDDAGKELLHDVRVWSLRPIGDTGEFLLDLTITMTPVAPSLVLGKTNFGLAAVRVARTMGVKDGGGRITDSEGRVNEAQLMPHRRARWCDYSGPAAPGEVNGITLFDHPMNPGHPAYFHVRDDGWMGASLTFGNAIEIAKENPLTLRYRYWIHRGLCDPHRAETHAVWE